MRTTTSAPERATFGAAAATSVRARSLSLGRMLSSRSRMITSAPRVCALSTNLSTFTGTNIIERQIGRSFCSVIAVPSLHRIYIRIK